LVSVWYYALQNFSSDLKKRKKKNQNKTKNKYNLHFSLARSAIAQVLLGQSKQLKQIIKSKQKQSSWLFTSVAQDLNSGLPRIKSGLSWSERDKN